MLATGCALAMWLSTLVGEHVSRIGKARVALIVVGVVAVVYWYRCHRWKPKSWLLLVLVALGASGGSGAWNGPSRVIDGACSGQALVRTDPTWVGRGVGVVLELHRIRYRVIAHGIAGSHLAQRLAGEQVLVRGQCGPTVGSYARYDRITHVLGRMNVEYVSEEFSEGN